MSGDRQEIANEIAHSLGIKEAYGQVFPDQKLAKIHQLQKQNHIVTMVGDGINDVAAIKAAHVGIAMGAMGMEPAIEAADIVLMTHELKHIYFVRKLAEAVMKKIKENLLIGFLLLHVLGIILTLTELITPIQAAFAHAVSDLLIVLNSSRLIRFTIED